MLFRRLKILPNVRWVLFSRQQSKKCGGKGGKSDGKLDAKILAKLDSGYAKLQASNSKSLLKKHLTPEIFKELRNKTTKKSNLYDCIKSGLKNHDSGCGIYAPDPEAYKVFADIFDPIIEDYHLGFSKCDKHPQPYFGNPCAFGDLDPNHYFIASTRIRCARSIKGFPFNPKMSQKDYDDVEDIIHCTLCSLDDEFKGIFQPIYGMSKSLQNKLTEDHYLFKTGDRFLEDANAYNHWPTGRSIFYNYAKTFLVWCNEEDHIRVISMQRGGHFGQVFSRFCRALNAMKNRIEFQYDERLGYLSFCPTNLGTAIRASVHIRLPNLSADKQNFVELAESLKLQVRGTGGEHTKAESGIYDVSNKYRLGVNEFTTIRQFYYAIKQLIDCEKSMQSKKSSKGQKEKKEPKTCKEQKEKKASKDDKKAKKEKKDCKAGKKEKKAKKDCKTDKKEKKPPKEVKKDKKDCKADKKEKAKACKDDKGKSKNKPDDKKKK